MLLTTSLFFVAVPMIAPHPELKEVAIGSTAVFPCLASGFPVPEVTWSKVVTSLHTLNSLNIRLDYTSISIR